MGTSAATNQFQSSVSPTRHPLVASFTLTAPAESKVSIQFGPTTSYGFSTWQVDAPPGGGSVTIQVAGMMAESTYQMRARIQLQGGLTIFDVNHPFTTGALPIGPDTFPKLTVSGTGPFSPGVELMTFVHPSRVAIAVDETGNIVWYYLDPDYETLHDCAFAVKLLPDGNWMTMLTNRYSNAKTQWGAIRVIDLVGNVIRQITLDDLNTKLDKIQTSKGTKVMASYFSHDVLPLANGHVVALCQEVRLFPEQEVWGDILVQMDETFEPKWVWSAWDWLDLGRHPMGLPDWTHSNCVQLTPDNNLLLSVRNQNWVLKLDWAGGAGTGEILWTLGDGGDFDLEAGDWFYAQHCPIILETEGPSITRLSVLDNGNDRPGPQPPVSRGLIMIMNETEKRAMPVWQWPQSPDFYSYWGGNVLPLANGNVEVCMSDAVEAGGAAGKSLVTEVSGNGEQIFWQATMSPPNCYRSFRFPSLYPGVQWS